MTLAVWPTQVVVSNSGLPVRGSSRGNRFVQHVVEGQEHEDAANRRHRSASKEKKTKKKKKGEKYASYICKVLKQVHPKISISKLAMMIMESCVNDTFERIAQEANRLMSLSKRDTMTTSPKFSLPSASCF